MAGVRSRDTAPERAVRRLLLGLGVRYRLHIPGLPGRPDIVIPRKRLAIFVHGCFWHHHSCSKGQIPQTNTEFWRSKILRTVERDCENVRDLNAQGWQVVTIWECETRRLDELDLALRRMLTS